MSRIMISACLLGINCRYNAIVKQYPELMELLTEQELIPFCPESSGGLTAPRPPAEIINGDGAAVLTGKAMVINREGRDSSAEFISGAMKVKEIYQKYQPDLIICKANSPSCGLGQIYDGSFTGRLHSGDGVAVALLKQAGAKLVTELEIEKIKSKILTKK